MRVKLVLNLFAPLLAASMLLSACDEAEQGRILRYEKGTYLGQKDRPLTDTEREELRHRTRLQQAGA